VLAPAGKSLENQKPQARAAAMAPVMIAFSPLPSNVASLLTSRQMKRQSIDHGVAVLKCCDKARKFNIVA